MPPRVDAPPKMAVKNTPNKFQEQVSRTSSGKVVPSSTNHVTGGEEFGDVQWEGWTPHTCFRSLAAHTCVTPAAPHHHGSTLLSVQVSRRWYKEDHKCERKCSKWTSVSMKCIRWGHIRTLVDSICESCKCLQHQCSFSHLFYCVHLLKFTLVIRHLSASPPECNTMSRLLWQASSDRLHC